MPSQFFFAPIPAGAAHANPQNTYEVNLTQLVNERDRCNAVNLLVSTVAKKIADDRVLIENHITQGVNNHYFQANNTDESVKNRLLM